MNNGPASVTGLPCPQRIFWRLSHNSCVVHLGLHQGGWRRTSPLAFHLTTLLPGSSKYSLITNCQHLLCQWESVGSIKCSPKTCRGCISPSSHWHKDCVMCWEMFKDIWTYTTFSLHSTERNAQAESNGSSRKGTNRQVLWYSILHWCQLLKSFFPMSDGTSWNMQISGASLKQKPLLAAWARKGLVFASSHSPRHRRSSMGEKRMGKSSLFNHLIITVSSNLLNTCLFHTQVVRGRQGWLTTVCSDCVNTPDIIQKPKPQCVICFLATLFL